MATLFLIRRSSSSSSRTTLAHFFIGKPILLPSPSSSPALVTRPFHAYAPAPLHITSSPLFPLSRRFHPGTDLRAGVAAIAADYSFAQDNRDYAVPSDVGLEISNLGISQEIVTALAGRGIQKLFPIQSAVLEPAMQGLDMIGRARTGTGKTLAFGIPIMDKIIKFNEKHGQGRNPLALVLAPTRELAKQVDKEFVESATRLETLCVYGGVPISRQMSTLDHGVDVVVGTPGRVIDLIKRGSLNLSEVQFVVLDEADQMLNVGFADDVETILGYMRQKHQTMMFSATMPNWIVKLTRKFLNNPITIDLVGDSDQKLADGISIYSIVSDMREKPAIIGPLITEHAKGGKCIVFTQTKRDADRLAYALQRNIKCEALHGDISQAQRERTLHAFREGQINVLVATDVAARGLDVPNVDLVIHYELPNTSETFVHRTGRTGRAGKKGSAILIYSSHQYREVKGIEREVGCQFMELPKVAVDPGALEQGGRFGYGGRMGGGRFGDSGFGHSGGFGGSKGGRFGGPGSGGGFGGQDPNRYGSFRGFCSGRTDGFGDVGGLDQRSGFGNFGGSSRPSSILQKKRQSRINVKEGSSEILISFQASGLTCKQWQKLKNSWSPGRTLFLTSSSVTRNKKGFFAQLAHSAGPTCILYLGEEASDKLTFLPSWDSGDHDLLFLYGQYRSTLADHKDVEKASELDDLETSLLLLYLPTSYLSFVCFHESNGI